MNALVCTDEKSKSWLFGWTELPYFFSEIAVAISKPKGYFILVVDEGDVLMYGVNNFNPSNDWDYEATPVVTLGPEIYRSHFHLEDINLEPIRMKEVK